MEKNNFFNERGIFCEQIGKYFDSKIPVTFNKLLDRYNFQIMSVDFEDLKQNTNLWNKNELDDAVGMVNFVDGEIHIYYNNNLDMAAQRFVMANLVAYCERQKLKRDKKSIIKNLDFMLKCDQRYDGMYDEELAEFSDNQLARQILMPKEVFMAEFLMWSDEYDNESVISILSNIFFVPEREVAIRGVELGFAVDLEKYDDKGLNNNKQYTKR